MLYIITAVHNRLPITQKFIKLLKQQTYKDYKFLLVDDGSTDGTADMVKRELPEAIVLYGNGNLWWGGALHKAYKYLCKNSTDCTHVMYINDDTEIENDFIEKAIKYVDASPDSLTTACGYDINTGKLVDGPVIFDVKTGELERLNAGETGNCGTTRALFMTYETYLHIGGFHPHILPHYASDYEYTIRAARKGHKIVSYTDLKYEFDPGTTGYNDFSKLTLKQLFSKRSRFNPIYRMNFVFLVTPIWYVPRNIMHGIKRARQERK